MIVAHTREEMLHRWRLVRHREPLRHDVTVTYDGVDDTPLIEARFDAWWLKLLDTAPLSLFEHVDVLQYAASSIDADNDCVELTFEPTSPFRRLARIKVKGWERPALLVEPGTPMARRQHNPYTRATAGWPVAVAVTRYRWNLYPATSTVIAEATGILENNYNCDDSCLTAMMSHECI